MYHVVKPELKTNSSARPDAESARELGIDSEDCDLRSSAETKFRHCSDEISKMKLTKDEERLFWYSVIYSVGSYVVKVSNSKKISRLEKPDHVSSSGEGITERCTNRNSVPLINKRKRSETSYQPRDRKKKRSGNVDEKGEEVINDHVVRCMFCGYWVLYMIAVAADDNRVVAI